MRKEHISEQLGDEDNLIWSAILSYLNRENAMHFQKMEGFRSCYYLYLCIYLINHRDQITYQSPE